jgi:hypothetical protein
MPRMVSEGGAEGDDVEGRVASEGGASVVGTLEVEGGSEGDTPAVSE